MLIAVDEHESLIERAELAEDVLTAEAEIVAGLGVPHSRALALVRARLARSDGS